MGARESRLEAAAWSMDAAISEAGRVLDATGA